MKSRTVVEYNAKNSPRLLPKILSNNLNTPRLQNISQAKMNNQSQDTLQNESIELINTAQIGKVDQNTLDKQNNIKHFINTIKERDEILQILLTQCIHMENSTQLIDKNITQIFNHMTKLHKYLNKISLQIVDKVVKVQ
ncbi:Hypothetical_protein [Hexamita inflata]|uniref:Hypothetical_protein n=1 Tax=Hexamita inflata TaxID=28002 RepID=A0AA86U9I2_9EUKA|nr:Hypothetical protein HINF_LOCUS31696 [Hexamita inflata]